MAAQVLAKDHQPNPKTESDEEAAMSDTINNAALLLNNMGVGPDDLEHLVRLGVSPSNKLEVLLPEECQPDLVAVLLMLVVHTTLDVARESDESNAAVAELIEHLQAGGKTQ